MKQEDERADEIGQKETNDAITETVECGEGTKLENGECVAAPSYIPEIITGIFSILAVVAAVFLTHYFTKKNRVADATAENRRRDRNLEPDTVGPIVSCARARVKVSGSLCRQAILVEFNNSGDEDLYIARISVLEKETGNVVPGASILTRLPEDPKELPNFTYPCEKGYTVNKGRLASFAITFEETLIKGDKYFQIKLITGVGDKLIDVTEPTPNISPNDRACVPEPTLEGLNGLTCTSD